MASSPVEQGRRRTGPIPLQVNERRRELDETFIERTVGAKPIFEPKAFEHLVRLEIVAEIETPEKSKVTGIKPVSLPASYRRLFVSGPG